MSTGDVRREMQVIEDSSMQKVSANNPDMANSRAQNVRTVTIIVSLLTASGSLGAFLLMVNRPEWQLAFLGSVYFTCAAFCIFALNNLYPRGAFLTGIISVSLLFGLAMISTSAVLTGLGFPAAIVYLIFIMIVSSTTANPHHGNLIAGIGILIAGTTALLSDFSPIEQISNQLIQVFTPAILGILFMIYVVMLLMQSVTATLRTRLVSTLLAMVLIPLAILSIFQSQFLFNVLNDETFHALQIAADQTALGLDDFFTSNIEAVTAAATLNAFSRYLELAPDQRRASPEEQAVRLALEALDANRTAAAGELSSYALLDLNGINRYDSLLDSPAAGITSTGLLSLGLNPEKINQGERPDESNQDYFFIPAHSGVAYSSPVQIPNSTRSVFYLSAPIRNANNQVVGVLRRRFDGLILQQIITKRIHLLGENSYPILLDENNIRLADTFTPQYIYKSVAPLSLQEIAILKSNQRLPNLPDHLLSTNYTDFEQILQRYDTQPNFTTEISTEYESNLLKEIGAIARMKTKPWKLVYLQTNYSDQVLRSQQSKITTLVTTLVACLIGLVAMGAAQLLSSPIIRLTKTAEYISQGNFDALAPTESSDEFGTLGRAFNLMTRQLRESINSLEERVLARTQEIEIQNQKLSHHARQLETVSDVARQIVSAQDLEVLLSSITHLISERFGFYHVGIFLLDEKKENAVLRAANSPGGQRMLARQHKLPVGKVGIVGYVTGAGEARIVTDVETDAVFFNNIDLPETRSEMAVPLKIGGAMIGAIDIQSTEPNAFHTEDIGLFNTLGDQVAIAIHNNQLFMETLQALDESQKLHRQYLQSEWAKDTSQRKELGYLYNQQGITPQKAENPLWEKVFSSGEAVYAVQPGRDETQDQAIMAVPVTIRGETIGVIHVQDQGEKRAWTEDEISVVTSIASQVAVALENARLFENTVRRAEREKKVLQITARIRSTNDPSEMMQIAVNELQEALKASRTQIYIRQSLPDPEQDLPDENGSVSPQQ
ncbi:MAG: GAF domain-containing protein [Anaerolineaceae bacterium]|nr:GAF domain-containing protein [Anaerolineaceae bacterium]